MAVQYNYYYNVDSNRTLGATGFPTPFTISKIEIDDQGGLERGATTTVSIKIQAGPIINDVDVAVEIVDVGSDGSLLVEAGELSGSFVSPLLDLLPQNGEILFLTDTPDLDGTNLDDLGVFDVEDPFIPPEQELYFDEGQADGFVVGSITATDNEAVTGFAIIDGDPNGFFEIDADGEISLTAAGSAEEAASNDFETQPNTFNLEIEASDAAGNTFTEIVAVHVTDVDDEKPVVSPGQSFSYAEGQSAGFLVGTVSATDNQAVAGFNITAGNENGFFAIDATGVITLTAAGAQAAAASNDFETGTNEFSLTVETTDPAGNKGLGTVDVSVTDVVEIPPITGTDNRDFLFGSRDGDTIDGLGGNDFLFGWKGGDTILGGDGNDFMAGGSGGDQINGGAGYDFAIGGQGEDLFVLSEGMGWDTILDCQQGQDKFGLQNGLTFEDLSFSGNLILYESDVLAVVRTTQTSQLTADDFLLL